LVACVTTEAKIKRWIRDITALGLGSGGFINEVFIKDKGELLLILLFFAMVAAPGALAAFALRSQGVDAPTGPSSPSLPPSQQQPSSSSSSNG
jgi:hypothetical protein